MVGILARMQLDDEQARIKHNAAIARANKATTRKYWLRMCDTFSKDRTPTLEKKYEKAIRAGVVRVERRRGKPPMLVWLI